MTGYASISHENGLGLDLGFTRVLGKDGYLQSKYYNLSYNYSAVDWLSVGLSYTKSKYDDNDSTTAFSGASNLLSMSFDIMPFDNIIVDLDYDRYFGSDVVNLYSLNFFGLFKIADIKISPMLALGWSSYTVSNSKLRKVGKVIGTSTFVNNKTGFASVLATIQIYYKLSDRFTISFSPSYINTTETSLSGKSSEPYFKLGVKYSLDF